MFKNLFESTNTTVTTPNAIEAQILNLLNSIKGQLDKMNVDLTALTSAVQQETTVGQSAITLITQLAAQIQSLVTAAASAGSNTVDATQLQSLVDQLNTNASSLSQAVTANTPSGAPGIPPPPPPPPPPAPPA